VYAAVSRLVAAIDDHARRRPTGPAGAPSPADLVHRGYEHFFRYTRRDSTRAAALFERAIAAGFNSLQNALKHLGMIEGQPMPWAGRPVYLERGHILLSEEGGVFERNVMVGEWIEKDGLFGEVLDFDGSLLEEIRAPEAGVVLTVISSPAIKPGGFAGKIGVVPALQGETL